MDGDDTRGTLIVVAATNHANSIDAALRRPGRFDRELYMSVPDVAQRLAILQLYTKHMHLHSDINLQTIANRCIGYVGADLEAVCREAAMIALHDYHMAHSSSSTTALPAASHTEEKKDNDNSNNYPLGTVTLRHFELALLKVGSSSLRGNGGIKDRTATTWDDIGGLELVKQQLHRAVEWPMKYSVTYTRLGLIPPRGILLYGPPGCAKTTLVRALASSASASFIHCDGASLYSSYIGESERAIRDLFARARANLPAVIFFDEIDSIVGKRTMNDAGDAGSGGTGVAGRLLSTLLNEMDGMAASRQLMVVAATNRADRLDDALLRPGIPSLRK
jgi:transitional endoplasmic reticulum ATPase